MITLINRYKYSLALFAIILLSGFFIFYGSNWGLPLLLHPDEPTIVETAIRMVDARSFEPDVFSRPDHLIIQINSLAYRFIVLLFELKSGFENIDVYDVNIELFYLAGRIITGLFAAGSIIVSCLIGNKHSRCAGIICAFLFAFFPGFVAHSHYVTPDVPTMFFMLLFIFFAMSYAEKPDYLNLAFMSLVTAFFITVKYPGAILCLMIAITVTVANAINKNYKRIFTHGAVSVIVIPAAIFLISPVLFLRISDVLGAIARESRTTHLGADGLGMGGNMKFYIDCYLSAAGAILPVFFLIGLYWLFSRKKNIIAYFPLLFSFVYWICLSCMPLHWERWAVPMYVSPLLISAFGIKKAYDAVSTHRLFAAHRKACIGILAAVICFSALNLMTNSWRTVLPFTFSDTRGLSLEYAADNGISAENSIYEVYTPLSPNGWGASWAPIHNQFENIDGFWYLKDDNIEYILLSSWWYDRYMSEPDRYRDEVEFYRHLAEHYDEIIRFSPYVPFSRYSRVDFINIFHNIDFIVKAYNTEPVEGPVIVFYKAGPGNYLPD